MRQFACGVVVPGCEAVFRAPDEPAILAQVAEHAARDHRIAEVGGEFVAAVRAEIVDAA